MNKPSLIHVLVNGQSHAVQVLERRRDSVKFFFNERTYVVEIENNVPQNETNSRPTSRTKPHTPSPLKAGELAILAPMSGLVTEIAVKANEKVSAGQMLLRIEAMKMQNNISASTDSQVLEILVQAGQEVREGEPLLLIKSK